MSRNHVSFLKVHLSPEVEVYRVCELEAVATEYEVTLAIAIFDRRKDDITIVPCGPWSGERVIASVLELFNAAEPGLMPTVPYGGKRMLYLLVKAESMLKRN